MNDHEGWTVIRSCWMADGTWPWVS